MVKKVLIIIGIVLVWTGAVLLAGYLWGFNRASTEFNEENQNRSSEFRTGADAFEDDVRAAALESARVTRELELSHNLLIGIRGEIEQGLREIDVAEGSVRRIIISVTILERILREIEKAESGFNSGDYNNSDISQYYYRNYSLYKRKPLD